METPPYQVDDYANKKQKKTKFGSLNENPVEDVKDDVKKKSFGSINENLKAIEDIDRASESSLVD